MNPGQQQKAPTGYGTLCGARESSKVTLEPIFPPREQSAGVNVHTHPVWAAFNITDVPT